MTSGFGSWFGLGGQESNGSPSLFGRLRSWGSPSTSVQNSNGTKAASSKKIVKSIEVDDEPADSPPKNRQNTPKKMINSNANNEISPSRIKGSNSKNSESPKHGHSRITKNQRIESSEKQEIIDRLGDHMKLIEKKPTSINSDSINELISKIKSDPNFKINEDSEADDSDDDSFEDLGSPKSKKKSTMMKELRALSLNMKSEPPIKKKRIDSSTPKRKRTLSSGDSKKKGQRSPVKTRGIVTSTETDSLAFCLICENTEGPFLRCNVCEFRFHASCIQIHMPIKYPSTSWRCFDCLRCAECMGYIDDAENVQCTRCGRAYHGYCKPVGSVGGYPFDNWHCVKCLKKIRMSKELEKFKRTKIAKKRVKVGHIIDKKSRIFFVPRTGIQNPNDRNNWIKFKKILTLTKPLNYEIPAKTAVIPKKINPNLKLRLKRRRFGLRNLNRKINEVQLKRSLKKADFVTEKVEAVAQEITEEYSNIDVEINGELEAALLPYQTIWPTEQYMENLANQKFKKSPKSSPNSAAKTSSKSSPRSSSKVNIKSNSKSSPVRTNVKEASSKSSPRNHTNSKHSISKSTPKSTPRTNIKDSYSRSTPRSTSKITSKQSNSKSSPKNVVKPNIKSDPQASPKSSKTNPKKSNSTPTKNTNTNSPSTPKSTGKKFNQKKNDVLNKEMYKYLSKFTFPDILDNYSKIKQKAIELSKSDMEVYNSMVEVLDYNEEVYQYIHFGPSYIVPAKRSIPSADPEFWNARLVFACHKCFWLFLSPFRFRLHLNMCEFTHPPGNEIYRDTIKTPDACERIISFFEVVGEEEMDYCRRLCTVASALLPAKSVTNEVEMFKFYVLTEFDENFGFIPAGFFSKENKPSQNNNLSCLLVFNQSRQSGYGKLLVDLSYLLSKREGKFGSPEHPLSDDGLYLYRSYWTSVIFQYLRKHRNDKKVSFEDMSKETHVYIDDIVSTMLANGMIKQPSGGKTLVDCVKAWFTDIRILRRRAVNPDKLVWEPEIDPNEEHNDRYVCSSDDDDY